MADEKNTVDMTIRNIPKATHATMGHVAALTGTPVSVMARDVLIETFSNPIRRFGMLSPLVDALDQVIGNHCSLPVVPEMVDSFYGTRWNLALQELLGIENDGQLQQILVKNTPYLTVRADQVMEGRKSVPKGTALWFGLFAEIAFSDDDIILRAWESVYFVPSAEHYYLYVQHINALRALRQLAPFDSFEFTLERDFGSVRLFRPDHYDYGAWHVIITLKPEAAAVLPGNGSTDGICFPGLSQRIFHAPAKQGYSCAAVNSRGEFESGFRFTDGRCELDVYSNGINEGANTTGLDEVISALADTLETRLL
ncbi:hypothetical protein [Enterobacter sp.]|uniref:hypothetical protein n=1 Tax=Enterobacter sp. TaxID=42895 RepID=UPI0039E3A3E1